MPIAGHKLADLRKDMTYAQFQASFGDGWLSPSATSESKYWFFDDGRTLVVPPECWKVPTQPLQYHLIGLTAAAPQLTIPILASPKEELKISTQPRPPNQITNYNSPLHPRLHPWSSGRPYWSGQGNDWTGIPFMSLGL